VERLGAAYRYLRTVENRIQALDDRQTHVLPGDDEARARLAYALGAADWEAFIERLSAHRRAVEREFERIAWDGRSGRDEDVGTSARQAWEAGDFAALLDGTPLAGNEGVIRQLEALRNGGLYQRMDEQSRRR